MAAILTRPMEDKHKFSTTQAIASSCWLWCEGPTGRRCCERVVLRRGGRCCRRLRGGWREGRRGNEVACGVMAAKNLTTEVYSCKHRSHSPICFGPIIWSLLCKSFLERGRRKGKKKKKRKDIGCDKGYIRYCVPPMIVLYLLPIGLFFRPFPKRETPRI